MPSRKSGILAALNLLAVTTALAGGGGPTPVSQLHQQSDVIVVATITGIKDIAISEAVHLNVISILAGQLTSATVTAEFLPPFGSPVPSGGMLPASEIGSTGVFFLKLANGGYQVIPTATGFYQWWDAFIPVGPSLVASAPAGTLDQQLMTFQVQWYLGLSNPAMIDDQRVYLSIERGDRAIGLAAAQTLIGSVQSRQRTTGLAAAITLGSDDAVVAAAGELSTLSSNPNFYYLVSSLGLHVPRTSAALNAIQQMIAPGATIPGLHRAISMALRMNGTRDVLPLMAELLDSPDPDTQLRAAAYFGYFSLFADNTGALPGTGAAGTFATSNTRQFTPSKESALTPAQYAEFWKLWWSQNRTTLGF